MESKALFHGASSNDPVKKTRANGYTDRIAMALLGGT